MLRKIAYAGTFFALVATATVIGCGGDDTVSRPDFASNSDGGPTGDLAGADLSVNNVMYTNATPNQVDTNTIGGQFGKGAAVKLSGLIVLAPPTSFTAKSGTQCKYEVWAQDPSCTTAPCGLVIVTQPIPLPSGSTFCPFAKDTATALKDVWKGDKITVSGLVDTFAATATAPATGTVVQHEVIIDTLVQDAKNQTLPNPMVVTDTTPSKFVPYSGTGWAMYEGTYITLKAASGKLTTSALDTRGGWTTSPGGASFADTYNSFFRPDGGLANMWPPEGTMYTSISAIVGLTFGGQLLPTQNSDFVP